MQVVVSAILIKVWSGQIYRDEAGDWQMLLEMVVDPLDTEGKVIDGDDLELLALKGFRGRQTETVPYEGEGNPTVEELAPVFIGWVAATHGGLVAQWAGKAITVSVANV